MGEKKARRGPSGRELVFPLSSSFQFAAGLVFVLPGGGGGIGGTSALDRRPECHPVSAPLAGLETPLVPLKILPFLVRGSRLPMSRSEEKMEEEEEAVEVEVEEDETAAATTAGGENDDTLIEEARELKSFPRPVCRHAGAERASAVMIEVGPKSADEGAPEKAWRRGVQLKS